TYDVEKKVNTTPVDYAVLNQLSQDFETRFVPQTELSVEQAFWSKNSVNSLEPTLSSRPTKVEVPKELPKVPAWIMLMRICMNVEKVSQTETELLKQKGFLLKKMITLKVKPSTSASGSRPSSKTKKDKIRQTPGTAHVQHSKLNANFELKCVKCNGCMLSDNHDLCVLNFINNVNARKKSKSIKKSSKTKVWKPTRKVFTNIGYIWRHTGWTFTTVGNACPLTRITTTTEVPLKKPTALENETPKPVVDQIVLWYSGLPPASKHMTGDRSHSPFRHKFLVQSNSKIDHMAKIMEWRLSKLEMLRSSGLHVEGLGHNLFSVGQFCDLNLEVTFRQHTCFIRNLEGVDLLTGSRGNNLYTLSLGE
ncbi:hypothetical protein Tco_0901298, partial [Tanacetum coccineum]